MSQHKPRYFTGGKWYVQESVTTSSLKAADLPAFMKEHGIPESAEMCAWTEYEEDGPVIAFTWLVPEKDGGEDPWQRPGASARK